MPSNLGKCEALALSLSPSDRAALAERLLASLDSFDNSENEQPWLEEADRRYQAYKSGKILSRPADDVLHDARASIK